MHICPRTWKLFWKFGPMRPWWKPYGRLWGERLRSWPPGFSRWRPSRRWRLPTATIKKFSSLKEMNKMENDDHPIGRVLSRREVLKFLGVASAAVLAGCAPAASQPTGVATPAPTTVPTQAAPATTAAPLPGTVKEAALLPLTFRVARITNGGCAPLEGAKVEIWHCDAAGVYSDVSDPGFNTVGQKFLRGYQVADANGQARFGTIYAGW